MKSIRLTAYNTISICMVLEICAMQMQHVPEQHEQAHTLSLSAIHLVNKKDLLGQSKSSKLHLYLEDVCGEEFACLLFPIFWVGFPPVLRGLSPQPFDMVRRQQLRDGRPIRYLYNAS